MTLDVDSLLHSHATLLPELAGHALAHVLFSYVKRSMRRRGLSRREMRKVSNRKRRWFVDNIIMHHKRLHDKNRQAIISNARSRALSRRKDQKKEQPSLAREFQRSEMNMKTNASLSLRQRGKRLRGLIDVRRVRARSRWLSVTSS